MGEASEADSDSVQGLGQPGDGAQETSLQLWHTAGPEYAKYYASGVLTITVHDRLVLDIGRYAEAAGIEPRYIYERPLAAQVAPSIAAWVRDYPVYKAAGSAGLALLGPGDRSSALRAVTGCFVRNFINARFMTKEGLLRMLKEDVLPDCTVLLVPNFFLGKGSGGAMPEWHGALLLDCLLDRQAKGQMTVLSITDLKALESEHGQMLYENISRQFNRVTLGAAS